MSRTCKRAKQFFKSFRELLTHGRFARWTFVVSVVLFLATLGLPVWRILPLAKEQPFIPLHYNIYFGVDRFGPWYHAFIIPALGLLFLLVSLIMQTHFFKKEKMLSTFFAISAIFLEFTFLVAMVLLLLLNV
jgi:hypothetical protein